MKRTYCHETNDEALREKVIAETYDKAYAIARERSAKHERSDKFDALEEEFCAQFSEEEAAEKRPLIKRYFHDDVLKKAMRNMILDEGIRPDDGQLDHRDPPDLLREWPACPARTAAAIFTRRTRRRSLSDRTLDACSARRRSIDVHRPSRPPSAIVLPLQLPAVTPPARRRPRTRPRDAARSATAALAGARPRIRWFCRRSKNSRTPIRVVSDSPRASNGSTSMGYRLRLAALALMDAGVHDQKTGCGYRDGSDHRHEIRKICRVVGHPRR